MLVTFVPATNGAPATFELAVRLLTSDGWNPRAEIPGPPSVPGQHFWVLTDALPLRFTVGAGRRGFMKVDLAAILQTAPHRLTFKSTTVRILDGFNRGYLTSGVVVATEQVVRLPIPPARHTDSRIILVLDCRRILREFVWDLVVGTYIKVQALIDRFQPQCPAEHIVSIRGAPVEHRDADVVFVLHDGIVLTVEFVQDFLDPPTEPNSPDDSLGLDDSDDSPGDPPPPAVGARDVALVSPTAGRNRQRSRTPRQGGGTVTGASPSAPLLLCYRPELGFTQGQASHSHGQVDMWTAVLTQAALPQSMQWTTSVLPWMRPSFSLDSFWQQSVVIHVQHPAMPRILQGLTVSALSICGPAPAALAASAFNPSGGEASAADSEPFITPATFAILSVQTAIEQLDLQILVPQSVEDVLDIVDASRDPAKRALRPHLVEVCPQPDARWGALIALPPWARHSLVVCLDLSAVGGAVFPVEAPPLVDRISVLLLAGMPSDSGCRIHRPGSRSDIIDGAEIQLAVGECVVFLPLGLRLLHAGWSRLEAPEGWISIPAVCSDIAHSVPAGWKVQISGCRPHWEWMWIHNGQVVVVSLAPACALDSAVADEPGHPPALSSDLSPEVPHHSQGGVAGEDSQDAQGDDTPGASHGQGPYRSAKAAIHVPHDYINLCLRSLQLILVIGLLACIAGERTFVLCCACVLHGRPGTVRVGLLLLCVSGTMIGTVTATGHVKLDGDNAEPAKHPSLLQIPARLIPTPSRAVTLPCFAPMRLSSHCGYSDGPTTNPREDLDISDAVLSEHLFFNAAPPPPAHLCLADCDVDWLDSDLTAVLSFKGLSLDVRTALVNVPIWCQAGSPTPERIDVYTDGSASTNTGALAPCAWAFAAFAIVNGRQFLIGQAAHQAAPPNTPFCLGEVLDDALTAELLALCWSMCWASQHLLHLSAPIHFWYDACSAGGGVFGASRPIAHAHVAGHSGNLGNELCDALANLARRAPASPFDRCLPEWPARWAAHPLAEWAWSTVPGQSDIPRLFCFESEVALAQCHDLEPVTAPDHGIQHAHKAAEDAIFSFCCISLNVLTLRDKEAKLPAAQVGMRLMGRKDILKSTLAGASPLFLGLQETRLPNSEIQADADYLILNSASTDRGMGGCALWIAKSIPIYRTSTESVYIRSQDVTVVSASPRHLTVHLQTPRMRLQLQVIHAPSTTSFPVEEVQAFWDARACEIMARPDGTDFIVFSDANARLGDVHSDHVGDLGAEVEGIAGALFHEFVIKIDAIVPSTWAQWHLGPHATWFSPFGTSSRIDYILVPRHWSVAELVSRTMPDVELMQARDDHVPVQLMCSFSRTLPSMVYRTTHKQVVRPDPSVAGAYASKALTQLVPVTSWTTGVDQHYRTLAAAWAEVGKELTVEQEAAPRQPYLSRATLDIVEERHALRASLKGWAREVTRRRMMIAFAAFVLHTRQDAFRAEGIAVADRWLREADQADAIALANYRRSTRSLRRAVALDRSDYLARLASEVASGSIGNAKALYKVLRKAFPASRPAKRLQLQPLPMLRLADGTMARTTSERAQAWRSHFASQEAGVQASDDEYAAAFAQSQPFPRTLDVSMLPTLASVEGHILAARNAKAVGPDGISAELLRLDVPITGRQLIPVFLKASLRAREPVAFRGGDLCCLAKRAGHLLSCDAYRSILVSSVPGKLLHRCLRDSLKPLLLNSQPPFQAGVAPGQGIEGVALAVRTFFSLGQRGGTSASLVFFDLQAAFYQVLRQTIVPTQSGDEDLLRLLHTLCIPGDAICELRDQLVRAAQLPKLGASSHAIALVQDLFRGTWFRLSGFSELVLTRRGARPGDPTADLLFGFTLSALFRSVHHCLESRHLLPALPCAAERPGFLEQNGSVSLGFPSWADDFVAPQTGSGSSDLLSRTCATLTAVVDFATSAGMTIKFGRDKTAALFPPAVLGLEDSRLWHAEDGTLQLRLCNSVTHAIYDVPVVESYRHLGGIVVSTGNPTPDLHFRYSQATGTLKPLRRKLFGAREIPMTTRAFLLRSLVISKFAHSVAALLLQAACHVRVWEQHYLALWRALFHRRAAGPQVHSFRVLHEAHAASPPLALAKARAGFLKRVFANGPRELLALLWDHWCLHPSSSWLAQLRDDITHVAQYVPSVLDLLATSDPVRSLLEAYDSDYFWWSRQVRTAEKAFFDDLSVWYNERRLGAVHDHSASGTPSSQAIACYLCSAAFPLRKHLHVHLARSHQVYAPARHFAISNVCTACLKFFPDVRQVQQHLKYSTTCLKRCLYLHAPLTYAQIRGLEAPRSKREAKVAHGNWKEFTGIPRGSRAPQAYGPLLPTSEERFATPADDEDPLSCLSRGFVPSPAHVVWITDHIASRSQEGRRQTAHRFWSKRPTSHLTRI
ncbi:tyrP-A [Symbiodinium necroappetens]|uniref:TyrP-A protein n=1 Tax=Symbiodinium necroappetens TaxID=1628268 RepID=A0A812UNI3_9DINO|nr:tyrP-A [Symbiodinium necroappetens]